MASLGFVDGLLDFSSDDEEDKPQKVLPSPNPNCSDPTSFNALDPDDPSQSLSEFVEEELEWISNKDAFPGVETFVDIVSIQPNISRHQNTVSMTEYSTSSTNSNNSNNSTTLLSCYDHLKVPVRARSKRHTRCHRSLADISSHQFWWSQMDNKVSKEESVITVSTIGRKCEHCGAEKTPQWRAGPLGPKTLCNACGVRFKSGRLVPEYRPASSPTFSSELHSNSHRKIVEMRRQKQAGMVFKTLEKG